MSVKAAVKGSLQGVLKGEIQGAIRETIRGANQEALQSVLSRLFQGALNPFRYGVSDQCLGMGGGAKRPPLDIWLFEDLIKPTYVTIKTFGISRGLSVTI